MSLLGGQVQCIEAICIAGVDVDAALQVLQHLVQVTRTGSPQEAGHSIHLRKKEGIVSIALRCCFLNLPFSSL